MLDALILFCYICDSDEEALELIAAEPPTEDSESINYYFVSVGVQVLLYM